LKRELKYIIRKLTDWKDFVFANPLLPFGTIREANAHCTHLQIAQANPQTEICKRVQSLPTLKHHFDSNLLLLISKNMLLNKS